MRNDEGLMINIEREKTFPLTEAPRRNELPTRREGKRIHVSTLYRWSKRGVRGVRLETLQVGGTLCTSIEALQRFFDALSRQGRGGQPLGQRTRESQLAKRDSGVIERELDQAGL